MAQIPEKIETTRYDNEGFHHDRNPSNIELAEKLNEIIDYLEVQEKLTKEDN